MTGNNFTPFEVSKNEYSGYFISCSSKKIAEMSQCIYLAQKESDLIVASSWMIEMQEKIEDPVERKISLRKSAMRNFRQINACWGVAAFVDPHVSSPGTMAEIVWAITHKVSTIVFLLDKEAKHLNSCSCNFEVLEDHVFEDGPWFMLNGLKIKYIRIRPQDITNVLCSLRNFFLFNDSGKLNVEKKEPPKKDTGLELVLNHEELVTLIMVIARANNNKVAMPGLAATGTGTDGSFPAHNLKSALAKALLEDKRVSLVKLPLYTKTIIGEYLAEKEIESRSNASKGDGNGD